MTVGCGYRPGACLRYSKINKRLIINKDRKNISVINPLTRRIEIEVEINVGDIINDFRLVGENEGRVVSITDDGYTLLYGLDYKRKTGSAIASYKDRVAEEWMEKPQSLAVCERSLYVVEEIGALGISSRMLILKLSHNTLVPMVFIDQVTQNIANKFALDCIGYAGSHILWLGLSRKWNQEGKSQVYDFDTQTRVFKELEERRVTHQENDPFRLHRLGDKFYYTGRNGKVMRISVSSK